MKNEIWTVTEYREYQRTGKMPDRFNFPVSAANVESRAGNEPAGPDAVEAINAPVSICVYSRRKRLTDSDGICAKYIIDAIVAAGILIDDSPKYVSETKYRQEKIEKNEHEETIVIIK